MESNKENSVYLPVRKSGRAWNGAHRDSGVVVHAIVGPESNGFWGGKALCGAEPGRRSNGWYLYQKYEDRKEVKMDITEATTCEKCLKKLKTYEN